MLTWYYDTHKSSANEILDVFSFFDNLDKNKKRTGEFIDDSSIKIEMPGVKSNDLEITLQGRLLKVKAKSRIDKEFSYTYTVSSLVDESAIEAKLEDGLLEISLPKKPESIPKKIKIS